MTSGNEIYHLTSRVPVYDKEGNITGVVGISTDITERKKMEEDLKVAKEAAEVADRTKTEFLQNMRHDIRTPMSGILGVTDLLKSTLQDTHSLELVGILEESSQALLSFMNQILEVVNINSRKLPILRKKFNLKKAIEDILKLHRAKSREKGLTLHLDYDANLPSYFVGGYLRVQRIVLELVGNALNFTHQGSVMVKVQKADQQRRQYTLKLSVIDTGIGIPLDQQSQIYTRFKRLTPSYQGVYKGLGLGLSVVKEFVDELEGELSVESQPQRGTAFHCLLPLDAALLDTEG